jgi:hypothetical protein
MPAAIDFTKSNDRGDALSGQAQDMLYQRI